ncbi:MAG: LytTR family DNA-binding domain-containing protein [Deltaproteobacteria bacterium]|nr:LytTR family DNA-binding domain-containing protein [Deltaproteobacteria bacterium]
MRALIVDDERVARNRLKRMLGRLEGVEVVGEAADGPDALERIAELEPDVAFLDIRMPGMDGLELAGKLPETTQVVFTTAYDDYALQAFETSAVDYLLKPIEAERLEAAVRKLEQRIGQPAAATADLERLLEKLAGRDDPPRITARRGDTIRVFDPRTISRFHAEDRYTVFRHDGRDFLLDESITSLERRLGDLGFLRTHRSELVRLDAIRALYREDDVNYLELDDGQRAAVSRRHLKALKQRLGIPVK